MKTGVAYTAAKTKEEIRDFRQKLSSHPPYSLDLAPSDYSLCLHLKKKNGSVDDVLVMTRDLRTGLRMLAQRYEKFLEAWKNEVDL